MRVAANSGLIVAAILLSVPAFAGSEWCNERYSDHRGSFCEEREVELPSSLSMLRLDSAPNGGIEVEGWDRNEVRLIARVRAEAYDDEAARELASAVRISVDGGVRASGPRSGRHEYWGVSYRAWVPRRFDLDLESNNGGITVNDVQGRISLDTRNGGLRVGQLGGDVRGRTTNGGLHVVLAGDAWEGEGLDLRTTNGGVEVEVPESYSARLEARTTNGGLRVDFPVVVHGDLGRGLDVDLGQGGRPIRVVTTNGGVRLRRP
jgi:hypothetical protein